LEIKNRNGKTPVHLVKSDSLKQIFKEHFDLFLEEVSPSIKKVSSGSDDDPIDVFDEFS
jgi:hypothetical protein